MRLKHLKVDAFMVANGPSGMYQQNIKVLSNDPPARLFGVIRTRTTLFNCSSDNASRFHPLASVYSQRNLLTIKRPEIA
jgi:hypothetical protein